MKWQNFKRRLNTKMKTQYVFGFLLLPIFIFLQCTRSVYEVAYPALSDNRYDSEYPYKNCSQELGTVFNAVKKISFLVQYEAFFFTPSVRADREDIHSGAYKEKAYLKNFYNSSGFGTATIIYKGMNRLALLTCAHVVSRPDTVVTYDQRAEDQQKSFIQSVSIKRSQKLFISDSDASGYLEVLALDKVNDIAIMGMMHEDIDPGTPVFAYPIGNTSDLDWGNFVYVLGYPVGYSMVTCGIVSRSNHDKKCFMIDTNFNGGFSGGIVLAVRDGVPNFELVGMVKSASAQTEYVLRPEKDISAYQYDPLMPYKGVSFVQVNSTINYGVTHAVCVEKIRDLYHKNKKAMEQKGYFLSAIFE